MHIDVVCRSTAGADGIRDHSLRLTQALGARPDATARAVDLRDHGDTRDLATVVAGAEHPPHQQAVLLQYNPFSFAPRGDAWWLRAALRELRRVRPDIAVVVLVHELWVTVDSFRHALLGVPQRLVFLGLRAETDLVAVSTASLITPASRLRRSSARVLPVGSNLPDERAARASMRARHDIDEDELVVTAFGTGHPSRLYHHIDRAVEAVMTSHPRAVALNLGSGAPPLAPRVADGRVISPGHLSEVDLARHLAMTDLLLLPFSDGVSTRRTTVMAGLQHGIPILGTSGVSTSAELDASPGLDLVASHPAPDTYAERARALVADRQERHRLGRAGRALFERRFSWAVIAQQLVTMTDEIGRSYAAASSSTRLV